MKDLDDLEMSDLEREIELEMDDSEKVEQEMSDDSGAERESDTGESDEGKEFEGAIVLEESDFETLDLEGTVEQEPTEGYAQRFHELSAREFEDESDLDREIGGLLNEMERQYFFGGFKKMLKKGLKYGAKSLLRKALKYGKGFPAFKGITQLARGNLKGALGTLAKQGLSKVLQMHPATAAGLTALKGLGFDPLGKAEANREAWNNYSAVVREAYDHLAENLSESSDQPLEASRQAANAFQTALQKVQSQTLPRSGKVHRIRMRPGQKITLIIEGA